MPPRTIRLWPWADALFQQDAPHTGLADRATQLDELAYDTQIAPTRVLFSHPHNQFSKPLPNLQGAADSTRLTTALLLSNPTLVRSKPHHRNQAIDLMLKLGSDGE